MPVTRLAPSPTGALHLGNARTFLVNYILARQNHWKIVLRIDDLDGPRIKPAMADQAMDDLRWLGIEWDEGPAYQSRRLDMYCRAIDALVASGEAYPCVCTRREVDLAASAPHADDGATVYPGTCRGRFASVAAAHAFAGRPPAIRFRVLPGQVTFHDHFAGNRSYDVERELGDFVIAKADGTPAYQLAVVVDDLEDRVTHIVRGDDLLDSTPRQMLLYRALHRLNLTHGHPAPDHFHLPLVLGPDGRRLAKRHGDTRLSAYREAGATASEILRLLGGWIGLSPWLKGAVNLGLIIDQFSLENLPRSPITFSPVHFNRLPSDVGA